MPVTIFSPEHCFMRRILTLVILAALPVLTAEDNRAATQPTADAAPLYLRAFSLIVTECPAASNLEYPGVPPFGPEWDEMEERAWKENADARKLAREARALSVANWPKGTAGNSPLNLARALANDLGDSALYQHLHGDDAAAIETIRDILHLRDLLCQTSEEPNLVRPLVGIGIDALAQYRLLMIASAARLTNDPADATGL